MYVGKKILQMYIYIWRGAWFHFHHHCSALYLQHFLICKCNKTGWFHDIFDIMMMMTGEDNEWKMESFHFSHYI